MSRPVRVLYLNQAAVSGGAAKNLLRMLETLSDSEVEAHVAAPGGGAFEAMIADLGLPFYPLPPCRVRPVANPVSSLRRLRSFSRYCRAAAEVCGRVQPQLVHGNSFIPACAAVRSTEAPVIWYAQDLRAPAPLVRVLRRRLTQIVAVSHAIKNRLEACSGHGAPIQTIYGGLTRLDLAGSSSSEQVRAEWKMPPGVPLIGCMAQMVAWKRHDLLLQALPLILQHEPQARLVFIGGDLCDDNHGYTRFLQRLAVKLGVQDRVIWTGHLLHPQDALRAVDVVAHPPEREPMGRVIIEALALGKPVVAVDRAGPAEILRHGKSGLLVPPRDPAAMASAVLSLLQNAELAETLRQGGLCRARDFQAAELSPLMVELYHQIIARRA